MAGITDLLGLGLPGSGFTISGPGGDTVPADSFVGQQAAPQAAPQAQTYQPPHGIKAFLGMLGDAMLTAHGLPPAYQNRVNQERENAALSGFLTNPDQAIQQLMQIDPKSGIELWRSAHPPSEKTMEQKVFEYEQGLPPEQRPAFEKSIQLTHPGMGTPMQVEYGTLGPDGRPLGSPSTTVPTVRDQSSYDAVPPGGHYTTDGVHIKQKPGGQTATPSGTFPGR